MQNISKDNKELYQQAFDEIKNDYKILNDFFQQDEVTVTQMAEWVNKATITLEKCRELITYCMLALVVRYEKDHQKNAGDNKTDS